MSLALKGIKVLDVSQAAAVPMAARHLGDFGADVIHIEHPLAGDSWRVNQAGTTRVGSTYAPASDFNYTWETFNRNKRSLTLDLSREGGQAVIYKLLEDTDILITNMRPSEQEKFRVDYQALHERFPRLIHASLSGLGKNGPERDLPAYDITAMMYRSGMHYALADRVKGDFVWRNAYGDVMAGISLFSGIMTALYVREQTGAGQQVDTSLFGMGVYQMSFDIAAFLATGTDFRELEAKKAQEEADTPQMQLISQLAAEAEVAMSRLRDEFAGFAPMTCTYSTRDGRKFRINVLQHDRYHPRFCRAIGREDLIDDPRFADHETRIANSQEYYIIMRDAFLTKTLDEWRPILNREEIPWAPEQTFREAVNDPQARANDFFVPFDHPTHGKMEVADNPLKLSETPSTVRLPAPEFSQHTEEILLEAGYTWEDIARFKEEGIIA